MKGQIDPEKSNFAVGKVKVEIRLVKVAQGRWGTLVGDSPDRTSLSLSSLPVLFTRSLFPLPRLSPTRRLHLHLPLLHLRPVRTQRRSATLLITLHHRLLRIFVRIREQVLEEIVHRAVAADVRVVVGRFGFFLVGFEDRGG